MKLSDWLDVQGKKKMKINWTHILCHENEPVKTNFWLIFRILEKLVTISNSVI